MRTSSLWRGSDRRRGQEGAEAVGGGELGVSILRRFCEACGPRAGEVKEVARRGGEGPAGDVGVAHEAEEGTVAAERDVARGAVENAGVPEAVNAIADAAAVAETGPAVCNEDAVGAAEAVDEGHGGLEVDEIIGA
eukprot:15478462-Alexandrium_andersonii.AAC.1